jgi:hypothetical protein
MADDVSPLATAQSITSDGLLLDCWYFAATSAELKAGKQFRRMIVGQTRRVPASGGSFVGWASS